MDERAALVSEYLTGLWTMGELCERFAISPKTGHKWVRRAAAIDRPARDGRPLRSPRAIPRRSRRASSGASWTRARGFRTGAPGNW